MIIGSKEMERILNPINIEGLVHEFIQPEMTMLNLFEKQNNNGDRHFEYSYSKRTAETDIVNGILGEPVEITEGSEFPQVAFSGIQEEYGNMTKLGFEVEFSEETVANPKNLAFIKDCVRDMGYTMRRIINRFAYYELIASAECPTITLGDGAWSVAGNEAIDDDITALKRAMENQANYKNKYHITDMYLSQNSYYGAEDLYKVIRPSGTFDGTVGGTILHASEEFASGLLAIDRNAHPAIWYYNLNAEDNRLNNPNDPNSSIINVNMFMDDDNDKHPKTMGYQLYVELGLAVNKEMAVLYQEGV